MSVPRDSRRHGQQRRGDEVPGAVHAVHDGLLLPQRRGPVPAGGMARCAGTWSTLVVIRLYCDAKVPRPYPPCIYIVPFSMAGPHHVLQRHVGPVRDGRHGGRHDADAACGETRWPRPDHVQVRHTTEYEQVAPFTRQRVLTTHPRAGVHGDDAGGARRRHEGDDPRFHRLRRGGGDVRHGRPDGARPLAANR
jgi:hypothetical protein